MEILNKVASIKSRSARAIGVFQKTVADLAAANAEIDKADAVRVKKAEVLAEKTRIAQEKIANERYELDLVRIQNSKIIDKVNEFLGIE